MCCGHKKKNHVYNNQGQEPIYQKYKAKKNMNRHNPKEKMKANNQQKIRKKNPM
jgi:hypothetical protein